MGAKGLISKSILGDIADSIRNKTGSEGLITPPNMSDAIDDIPSGNAEFIYSDTLEYGFMGHCLRSISIPEGYTTIQNDSGVIRDNSLLESVELPSTIEYLWNETFENCSSLVSVDFSKCVSLEYLCQEGSDYGVFENCPSLERIDLSNCTSLTTLYDYTFGNCQSLDYIDLPSSIQSINESIFYGDENLTTFICRATTPPTIVNYSGSVQITLFGDSPNVIIYVPAESVNAYKAASGWSDFADRIQAIPAE